MNDELINKILVYKAKLELITILLNQMPIEKAKEISKAVVDIDLDELEKQL